jgi:hypothetical protein
MFFEKHIGELLSQSGILLLTKNQIKSPIYSTAFSDIDHCTLYNTIRKDIY